MKNKDSRNIFLKSQGDVVVDDLALTTLLDDFHDQKIAEKTKYISNVSRVIESFVFYERVFIVSYERDKENQEGYYMTHNPLVLSSVIEELSQENVLNFVTTSPFRMAPQPSQLLSQAINMELVSEESLAKFNAPVLASYLYQLEVARNMGVPFVSSDSDYSKLLIRNNNSLKYSLSQKLLDEINKRTSREFDQLLRTQQDISYYVPPFLSIVLDKVIRGSSFGSAILDVRDQFKSIRRLFADYSAKLNDSSKSLSQIIKITSMVTKEIEKVASTFPIMDRTTLTIWGDTFDFLMDSVPDLYNFVPIKSAGLISKLRKLSSDTLEMLIIKRRYGSIFKLKKDFYNLKKYSTLLNDAIIPSMTQAKKMWPDGYICVTPGNPFRDLDP